MTPDQFLNVAGSLAALFTLTTLGTAWFFVKGSHHG